MDTSPLCLYAVFHLNLAYSSISAKQHLQVINNCYWPLLRIIDDLNIPLGIELTAYTIERIAAIDGKWLAMFRQLLKQGKCELIGSGDSQIIAPLVPAALNKANLAYGNKCYASTFGLQPKIALINEQVYASGIVPHYLAAGYQALLMEWDNPASQHPTWPRSWGYLPQIASGTGGSEIPILWIHSIAFQKFQRYAHGEITLSDYMEYIASHQTMTRRLFPLCVNDIEIFDFRPERYTTEAPLEQLCEWERIRQLFMLLLSDSRFSFCLPSKGLEFLALPDAGNRLHLQTSLHPTPVKKQPKYNISRWAISGRNDLWLNTLCHRIAQHLPKDTNDLVWQRLCRLWGSDLRTHITPERWQACHQEILHFMAELGIASASTTNTSVATAEVVKPAGITVYYDQSRYYLTVVTPTIRAVFNFRRGLTIRSLAFASHGFTPIIGTVDHGYFDSIDLGADFYSGGIIIELPVERRRITDLTPVKVTVKYFDDGVLIHTVIKTDKGMIEKSYHLAIDKEVITYKLGFPQWIRPLGTVRVGQFTLIPKAFSGGLCYQCKNGGDDYELYLLDQECKQSNPVSSLISCSSGMGATDGTILLGQPDKGIVFSWDPGSCAVFPMLFYQPARPTFLARMVFSLAELDDTFAEGGALLPLSLRLGPYSILR